jgi:hypothetical protein
MNYLIAALIVVPLAALLFGVGVVIGWITQQLVFRELATVACPFCLLPIGLRAVAEGRDCSPMEELWEVEGALLHCYPICRSIKCEHCDDCFVVRLNREGERFGPRLSIEQDPEGMATPELKSELRAWLAEHKDRRRTKRYT